MNRKILILSFIFIICLCLVSCKNEQNTFPAGQDNNKITIPATTSSITTAPISTLTDSSENDNDLNELTIDDLKKNYADFNIIGITKYKERYCLVEYQKGVGYANRFDFYNLKTGDRDELQTMTNYTKLLDMTDENNIKLLATGKDSETNTIFFPFIMSYHRGKEILNNSSDFILKEESYFAEINQSIIFGDDSKSAIIYSIVQTENGFNVYFKPTPENENEFKIFGYIPITTTAFETKINQFILTFDNTKIDNKAAISFQKNNYITHIDATNEDQNKGKIVSTLTAKASKYTASVEKESDVSICLKIVFN